MRRKPAHSKGVRVVRTGEGKNGERTDKLETHRDEQVPSKAEEVTDRKTVNDDVVRREGSSGGENRRLPVRRGGVSVCVVVSLLVERSMLATQRRVKAKNAQAIPRPCPDPPQ